MTIDPGAIDARDVYKLLVSAIVPRPIAFVLSLSAGGVPNLAPFSFFTAISANPPVICFSPLVRGTDGSTKDTLRNIRETREFVVNIVSESFASQMNICSAEYPREVDEFLKSGLTPVASEVVKPPRVKESMVNMECSLLEIVEISAEPLGGSLVIGKIHRFHVRDEVADHFKIDPERLHAIGRMGGPTYTRTTDRFDMERPTGKQ